MATSVSSRPRGARSTTERLLVHVPVDVAEELFAVDPPRLGEERGQGGGRHKSLPSQRAQFSDRSPVPRHDEGLAVLDLSKDGARVVPQLPLADLAGRFAHASM